LEISVPGLSPAHSYYVTVGTEAVGRAAGLKETRQDTWAQKFTEYQLALNRFFRRRHLHRQDAEDLAQEVYLRLLRAEQAESGAIRNPEAYLFTVAVNLLRERAALAARGGAMASLEDVEERFLTADPAPEDEIERLAREQRLSEVVSNLPPKFRAVIVMHYHHGLSYQDMAKRIGVSPNTIKKHISQALRLCRRQLRQIDGGRL
jgi:RNA polymerase sigma factor (sigma-70 family)